VLGGKITGVFDWDGGALGHPGYDLALITEPCPEAFRHAADLDAFYIGYGGKRLSAPDQGFFLDLYEFF
jgi:aminoglycoside phosphotransferase (APT) family kinase protein